ncbi:MAG: VWA domain-containing protein [Vicinamibacterales bacterium]
MFIVLTALIAAGAPAAFAQTTASATSPQAPSTGAPQSTFKSGTELVALNVTVTDQGQNYVAGLLETDFAVFEDGVKQDVSFFAANQVPIDLILLMDTSASMVDKMSLAREAALGFLRKLREEDRGAIVSFNDGVKVLQGLTADRAALELALTGLRPAGATALHNAIYVSLREFGRTAKQAGEVRRQAIAVFSDGDDTASLIAFEDVLEQARRSGVGVYTISLQSPSAIARRGAARRYFSQSDYAMKTIAQETGAQAFFPERIQELPGVYGRIAAELGAQYSLAYAPKNARKDGRFRRVVVQILSRPDARPRTRAGYFAEILRAPLAALGVR